MLNLRSYQKECLESILENANKGITRQVAVLATGLGKTVIFSHLIPIIKSRGKKILVLCHREELIYQAKDKIELVTPSLNIGIEQASKECSLSEDVIIASVPTLGRKGSNRITKFNPDAFGLIIQDECHHATSKSFKRVYEYFGALKGKNWNGNKILLGFTATPHRADHIGLDTIFDKIVYNYPLRKGIENGFLVNIRAFTAQTATDISKVKIRAGDFAGRELEEAINTEERNKLIVETYKELTPDTKALVFAVDVQHTKDLCAYFQSAEVVSKYVIGETEKEERKNIIQEFKEGKFKVLVNCGCFTEGFDEPSIETILMARPTKSSVLFQQMIGRGLRVTEIKKFVNVIDFVDNTGKNKIVTLPSLFGCEATLKGTKGRLITEIIDLVDKMKEVNPDYDVSQIEDWSDEDRIEKVIKEIDIFALAEIAREVKEHSLYSWEKWEDKFKLDFPPNKEGFKIKLELVPDMLNQYETRKKVYKKVIPGRKNGFSGWQKVSENIELRSVNLEEGFKNSDNLVTNNFREYVPLFSQRGNWRKDPPTEKQCALLRKFNVPLSERLTKGDCAVLISKAIGKKL